MGDQDHYYVEAHTLLIAHNNFGLFSYGFNRYMFITQIFSWVDII